MVAFLFLTIVTMIYLVQATVIDIKEKKIYSFPCIVLCALWGMYLTCLGQRELSFLGVFWAVHILILILFNKYQIWGAGDSDILLLFANVFLCFTGSLNVYAVVFYECIGLIVALVFSLLVGGIEYRVRHKKLSVTEKLAVVPGFSVVMCILIVVMIRRYFL